MRDYVPRIHGAGAELLILGNGTPEQAQWFVEDFHVETPVFTDPTLRSHAIVGAGSLSLVHIQSAGAAVRAMQKGFRQTRTMGSARQLGGVFVIDSEARMPYQYLSRYAGDHPNPEDAIQVIETLAVRGGDSNLPTELDDG